MLKVRVVVLYTAKPQPYFIFKGGVWNILYCLSVAYIFRNLQHTNISTSSYITVAICIHTNNIMRWQTGRDIHRTFKNYTKKSFSLASLISFEGRSFLALIHNVYFLYGFILVDTCILWTESLYIACNDRDLTA